MTQFHSNITFDEKVGPSPWETPLPGANLRMSPCLRKQGGLREPEPMLVLITVNSCYVVRYSGVLEGVRSPMVVTALSGTLGGRINHAVSTIDIQAWDRTHSVTEQLDDLAHHVASCPNLDGTSAYTADLLTREELELRDADGVLVVGTTAIRQAFWVLA